MITLYSVEQLPGESVDSQLDSLFFSFKPLFQAIELFGKRNVLLCNAMLSNESGRQFSVGVFWSIDIDDFSVFASNESNTVFAHRSHCSGHAIAVYFDLSAFVANGDVVKIVTTAAIGQKCVVHAVSPCFYSIAIVSTHPKFIIDQAKFWVYTVLAAAKSVAGRGNPELTIAHDRALAVFLCAKHCHTRIMVGRAGQPKGWPVPMVAGISTPVRLTTYQVVENLGGELLKLTIEAAIMATIPTLDPFSEMTREMSLVTTALRSLRRIKSISQQPDASLSQTITALQNERDRLVAQILPFVHRSLSFSGEVS